MPATPVALVDSPRFSAPLVKRLEALGGVRYLYLTHRDDVADYQRFHDRFGVDEYYLYDPDRHELSGWQRREGFLDVIEPVAGWVSPQLQIRFDLSSPELQIYRPDSQRFLSYVEIAQRAETERQRAEAAEDKATRLAQRLQELGIDPDQI